MALPASLVQIGFGFLLGIAAEAVYFTAMETPEPVYLALIVCGSIYFVSGLILGLTSPRAGWGGGLWIAAPAWILTGLHMLLGVYVPGIFTTDLPLLVTLVVAACLGVFLGGKVRRLMKSQT